MLVDNRFDNVKGWGKLENGSSKRGKNKELDKDHNLVMQIEY